VSFLNVPESRSVKLSNKAETTCHALLRWSLPIPPIIAALSLHGGNSAAL
jgi:hypothetical protein